MQQKQGFIVLYDYHKRRFRSRNMLTCFCVISTKMPILLILLFAYFLWFSQKKSDFHRVIFLCVLRFLQKYRLSFQDTFHCFTIFSHKSNFFLIVITKFLIVLAFCIYVWYVSHNGAYGWGEGMYRALVGKPEGKRPLGRPRRRWVDNIRMDLQEVGCGYMDWIGPAQDRDSWRTLVSAVMNLRVPWNAGNFLSSWKPVSFWRRTAPWSKSVVLITNVDYSFNTINQLL